jgi:hypothetical protein
MDRFTSPLTAAQFRYIAAFEAERAARAEWYTAAATLRAAEADLGAVEKVLVVRLLTLPTLEVVAA